MKTINFSTRVLNPTISNKVHLVTAISYRLLVSWLKILTELKSYSMMTKPTKKEYLQSILPRMVSSNKSSSTIKSHACINEQHSLDQMETKCGLWFSRKPGRSFTAPTKELMEDKLSILSEIYLEHQVSN